MTIPEPYDDVDSLRATAMATKELVEMLAGQRGNPMDVAVTWEDLVKLNSIPAGKSTKRYWIRSSSMTMHAARR